VTPKDERRFDEQVVLATLLRWPRRNAWELGGLEADMFADADHRVIAQALCELRDSGRFVHWRRVKGLVKRRRPDLAFFVEGLSRALGTDAGLSPAVARLHAARARRAA
jgi:hypothetical protein